MSSNSNQEPKYRPSFSAAEIAYLVDLAQNDSREATAELAIAVAGKLRLFALKMQFKLVNPAFVATPRESIESQLGFDSAPVRRKAAYAKYLLNPELCTAADMKLVNLYMYENGLMTPEQEKEYEKL